MKWHTVLSGLALVGACNAIPSWPPKKPICVVKPSGTNATDDAPAIRKAFKKCGTGGRVVFLPTEYYVNSPLRIDWLDNVHVDLLGTLLV